MPLCLIIDAYSTLTGLIRSKNRVTRVEVLQQHCKELGMDCSVFVLSHNDLGPTNIIINGDRIVVLDWEMAGYAPLEWV